MRSFDVYQINPEYRKVGGPVLVAYSILNRPFPGTRPVPSGPIVEFLGTFDGMNEAEAISKARGTK